MASSTPEYHKGVCVYLGAADVGVVVGGGVVHGAVVRPHRHHVGGAQVAVGARHRRLAVLN